MRAQPRRQLLVDTASRLFNELGYRATGIDLILAESGVAKATLYKHFRSKDELILTVLRRRHEEVYSVMEESFRNAKKAGVKQPVLFLFDMLNELINNKDFYGCNFINACSEYTESTNEIHKYAAQHKEKIQVLLMQYLVDDNEDHKLEKSEAILLLMDGAIVSAQVRGNKDAAIMAKAAAEKVLN